MLLISLYNLSRCTVNITSNVTNHIRKREQCYTQMLALSIKAKVTPAPSSHVGL